MSEEIKPGLPKRIFLFLTSWIFWRNILMMVAVSVIMYFMLFQMLKCGTNHKQSYEVPNFVGMPLDDVLDEADKRGFHFNIEVTDSMFIKDQRRGIVLSQTPDPEARAKDDRTIYLTINSFTPPQIDVPPIKYGVPVKNLMSRLEGFGLVPVIVEKRFGYPPGTLVEAKYNGKVIVSRNVEFKPFQVPSGSKIELVVLEESNAGNTDIPDLVCKTYSEAMFQLKSGHQLSLGSISIDASVKDTANAFVWRQLPPYEPGRPIRIGEQIDIFLTQNPPTNCPSR